MMPLHQLIHIFVLAGAGASVLTTGVLAYRRGERTTSALIVGGLMLIVAAFTSY